VTSQTRRPRTAGFLHHGQSRRRAAAVNMPGSQTCRPGLTAASTGTSSTAEEPRYQPQDQQPVYTDTLTSSRLLARTRRASRFASASAFANYAGVAPVEVSSAERVRHRLPRGGDRQLNFALHIVALTQVRMSGSAGRAYYDTKIAARKTHNEAMRCLKRRLADHMWRAMIRDERQQSAGPGGHQGATLQSSAAGSTPTTSSSDKSLPEPATPDSTTGQTAA